MDLGTSNHHIWTAYFDPNLILTYLHITHYQNLCTVIKPQAKKAIKYLSSPHKKTPRNVRPGHINSFSGGLFQSWVELANKHIPPRCFWYKQPFLYSKYSNHVIQPSKSCNNPLPFYSLLALLNTSYLNTDIFWAVTRGEDELQTKKLSIRF